jgi:hypothetical protein
MNDDASLRERGMREAAVRERNREVCTCLGSNIAKTCAASLGSYDTLIAQESLRVCAYTQWSQNGPMAFKHCKWSINNALEWTVLVVRVVVCPPELSSILQHIVRTHSPHKKDPPTSTAKSESPTQATSNTRWTRSIRYYKCTNRYILLNVAIRTSAHLNI